MGKSTAPPPAPNFPQVAQQQGAANVDAAVASAKLSNPNIISPYGNQTVTYGTGTQQQTTPGHWSGTPGQSQWIDATTQNVPGDPNIPTVTQTLTPAGQATVDEQQNAQLELARLGNYIVSDNTPGGFRQTVTTPFSFSQTPQESLGSAGGIMQGSNPGDYWQTSGANYGQVSGAPNLSTFGSAQGVQGNQYGQAQGGVAAPQLQSNVGTYNANTGLDQSNVAAMPINAGQTAQQAIMSRLQPAQAQQRTSTETQLINQGLRPGGEAYDNAINLLGQQENDARSQAALQGLNLDLSANQQGFGQALQKGQFANQAQGQNFTQGVQAGQFGNEAQLASFGAGLQNQQAQNQAIGQNFTQGLQGSQSINSAIGQNQESALAQQQAANTAQAQGFGNAQTVQQAQNAATQQNFQNRSTQTQQFNAAQQQLYSQLLQSGQFGNAAQQQALAQALQLRDVPLNEISALLSGSQIQNPQFQAFQGQAVAPTPVMQGAQNQASWDQNIYNQQVAQKNALTQGLFSLGGAAAGMVSPFKLCWIAQAIYGDDDPRVGCIRNYLLGPFSKHRRGRLIVWLYRKTGKQVARAIKRSSVLRRAFKPIFDRVVMEALYA